jgi:hypothetical protein
MTQNQNNAKTNQNDAFNTVKDAVYEEYLTGAFAFIYAETKNIASSVDGWHPCFMQTTAPTVKDPFTLALSLGIEKAKVSDMFPPEHDERINFLFETAESGSEWTSRNLPATVKTLFVSALADVKAWADRQLNPSDETLLHYYDTVYAPKHAENVALVAQIA